MILLYKRETNCTLMICKCRKRSICTQPIDENCQAFESFLANEFFKLFCEFVCGRNNFRFTGDVVARLADNLKYENFDCTKYGITETGVKMSHCTIHISIVDTHGTYLKTI